MDDTTHRDMLAQQVIDEQAERIARLEHDARLMAFAINVLFERVWGGGHEEMIEIAQRTD